MSSVEASVLRLSLASVVGAPRVLTHECHDQCPTRTGAAKRSFLFLIEKLPHREPAQRAACYPIPMMPIARLAGRRGRAGTAAAPVCERVGDWDLRCVI